ncbi:MAG: hypothetical protein J6P09_05495 [Methanobrevibacter sp.]|nr:hypothetical protein [Methanobrevibacter sp.]
MECFKMRLTEKQRKEIREDILFFLFRNNYWQSRHCPEVNICNKLSQHSCKHLKKELKKLFKDEIIRYYPTAHGKDDVYLNIHKKAEIEAEIKDKLDKLYGWKK